MVHKIIEKIPYREDNAFIFLAENHFFTILIVSFQSGLV